MRDLQDRLEAIVRAYVLPAFTSGSDLAGGGARFTRLRAVMSAEGNEVVRKIIAQTFDDTSHAFIDAIHESLPHIPRTEIVWRGHFLLGALYYTLVTPERVSRLSRGSADGTDAGNAIEQLVRATVAAMQAPPLDQTAARAQASRRTPCSRRPFPDLIPTPGFRSSNLPPLACDAHCHIFGPGSKYPYAPDRPYTPPDAPLEDFRALHAKLGVGRAVIVNASVHGTDNRVALDAIAVSGGAYRAVANLDDAISERGLRELHDGGFRGCRFNFVRHLGGVPDKRVFERVIDMVAPLGWHVDLHFDAIDLPDYADMLARLPLRYTIDHMGRVKAAGRARSVAVQDADRTDAARRKMLGKGLRLRARVLGRAALYRCGAVRTQDRRDRAGSRDLGHRLAASQRQGDAERRRPRRSHSAVRAGAGAAAEDTGR